MDFKELEYMLTVERTGNITKAAEILHISQPSLSQFIRKIENIEGYEIFDRRARVLVPTQKGHEYIRTATVILNEKKDLARRVEDISEMRRGHVTIGVTTQRGFHMLPEIIAEYKKEHPGIEVKIIEKLSSDELEKSTILGDIDLFLSMIPFTNRGLEYDLLFEDTLFLVVPPAYQLPYKPSEFDFDRAMNFLKTLDSEKFILQPKMMKLRRLTNSLFERAGFNPDIILETHNVDTAQLMVLNGLGITFTLFSVLLDPRIKPRPQFIPINDPHIKTSLVIGYSDKRYLSKAAKSFINVLHRTVQQKISH